MTKNRLLILGLFILMSLLTVQCSSGPAATQPAPAAPQAAAVKSPAKAEQAEQAAPAAAVEEPAAAAVEAPAAAALDGKALFEGRCSKCHGIDKATSKKKTADEWKGTVERMVGKGAELSADEQKAVIDYLAATYPK